MKQFFFNSIIFIICFSSLVSCGDTKENVNLRLTHAENKEIEAIYTGRLDSLRPLWDSLCKTNHDGMVAHALDSIIKERLAEEAILRNRLSKGK